MPMLVVHFEARFSAGPFSFFLSFDTITPSHLAEEKRKQTNNQKKKKNLRMA